MHLDKNILEWILALYLYVYWDFWLCIVSDIDKELFIEEHVLLLNQYFWDIFSISITQDSILEIVIIDFTKWRNLDNSYLAVFNQLSRNRDEKKNAWWHLYNAMKNDLDEETKLILLTFYSRRCIKSIDLNIIENKKLRYLLGLSIHWFIFKDLNNIKISLQYLEKLIIMFPENIFLLNCKLRQHFFIFYFFSYWKLKFKRDIIQWNKKNKIISSTKFVEVNKVIKKIQSLDSNDDTFLLFYGKVRLLFHEVEGVAILHKFLLQNKILYEDDVFCWLGTYYLEINDIKTANFYINNLEYIWEDNYKALEKKMFLYRVSEQKKQFNNMLEKSFDIHIIYIIYQWRYYLFQDDNIQEVERFDFDLSWINHISLWLEIPSILGFQSDIYPYISKDIYNSFHVNGDHIILKIKSV